MKKSPLLIALTVFLLGIALLIVPTVGANSTLTQSQSYPDSVGIVPATPAGAPERVDLSLALESMAPISAAYGTEVVNNFFAQLDLTDSAVLTNVLDPHPAIFAADLAVDNSLVYAIVSNNPGADEFITFELGSPATSTVIGPISPAAGEEWGGMAVAPDNTVYASSTQCGTRSTLYTVNPLTGVATQVGEITGSPCISAIAADAGGTLWGVDNTNDNLVTINASTGASSAVGNLGFNADFNQGLEYNENDNALYLAAFNATAFQAQLHELDTTNGSTVMSDTIGDSSPGGTVQMGWLAIETPVDDPIPAVPAITLDKTVGTDAASCATEDNIFVDEGDMVYYCYTVTNVGDITLTNHSLVDSELGPLLTDTVVSLVPAASYMYTTSASIMETTVNTATWTATAGMSSTNAIDTAMVTVIPENGSAPDADIPDDNSTGVTDMITITESGVLTDLNVYLDIHHPWVGDLVVTLEHMESGVSVELVNRPEAMTTTHALAALGDCDGDDIHNTLDDQATPSIQTDCQGGDGMQAYMMGASYQPAGDLDDFAAAGVPFAGTWEINVRDASATQLGTFVIWALEGSVAEPEIDVVPTSITSTQIISTTTMHPLTISNSGDAVLAWDITSSVTWATVDTMSGTTPISDSSNLVVSFNAGGLAPGVYTGTLSIANNDADENPVTVDLMLTVEGLPAGCGIVTEDFNAGTAGFPPADWMVVNNGGTCVWESSETTGTDNLTGGDGFAAIANSDACGQGTTTDTDMYSPFFSLAGATNPAFGYRYDYRHLGSSEGTVDISIDGGMNWTNLDLYQADDRGPASNVLDLSAYANEPLVQLRFGYHNAGWDWWFQVDDVTVACTPVPDIDVAPTTITDTLMVDEMSDQMLMIENLDIGTLDWTLDEGCGTPVDWMSLAPTSGSTVGLSSSDVTVSFDATGLAAGEYTSSICVNSNDADEPTIEIPVTLTVEELLIADIDINPTSMESMQGSDEKVTQTLTIENMGDADLEWMIVEQAATVNVSNSQHEAQPHETDRANQSGKQQEPAAAVILPDPAASAAGGDLSEGFDDITTLPGAGWAQINNSEPLGTSGWFQGNTDVFTAQAGADNSYIGANFNSSGDGTISNWLLTPELTLQNGAEMSFYTRVPTGSTFPDRLEVRMSVAGDSTDVGADSASVGDFTELLLEINPDLTNEYPDDWAQFTVTLSGLGGATTGRLAFRYFVTEAGPTGANSNFIGIDTFEYMASGGCIADDISWASVSPMSGTTAPGTSSEVSVSFNSGDLMPGDYMGSLCIESNDPDEAMVIVPLTLTVEEEAVPAIELVKTVGTEMGVCATTDVITVTIPTDVYYCYTVTNTGNITLPLHDLDDDQLGMLLLDDFEFDLAPGASVSTVDAGAVFTAMITETTMNTAVWTAFIDDDVLAEASASATVNLIPTTAVEMAELATSSNSNVPLALAVAGMMLVLAGGFVVRRRRTQ